MSKNEEKAIAEQTVPAETPEAVEKQAVQTVSEQAADAAVQSTASAEPPQDTAPELPQRPQIVVAAPQGLNLREGPHVSYAVKAVLPDGAPVEILNLPEDVEVPNWALVKTCAGVGWVNTNFLVELET